jgi:hypothetical protein
LPWQARPTNYLASQIDMQRERFEREKRREKLILSHISKRGNVCVCERDRELG